MYTMEDIEAVDMEIAQAIKDEFDRQNSHIELIASENWVSPAVMSAMGSVWMSWRSWQESARRSCSAVTMSTCSHIPEHRRIWQCSSLF